jgi:hypothetical protein
MDRSVDAQARMIRRLVAGALLLAACSSSPSPSPSSTATTATANATTDTSPQTTTATATTAPTIDAALPSRALTPGVTNPNVTQADIHTTICVSGWTTTVRPSVSYTDNLKRQQMIAYHRAGTIAQYEEDHLVPLEVGGNPTDPGNLWPEPRAGAPEAVGGRTASDKDLVENAAKKSVCAGGLPLDDAQRGFEMDWVQLGRSLGAIR